MNMNHFRGDVEKVVVLGGGTYLLREGGLNTTFGQNIPLFVFASIQKPSKRVNTQ